METISLWVGYIVISAGGVCAIAGAVIGAAILSNRAQHKLLETIGGWKAFMEYRDWFHDQKRNG